eukprot:tig00020927_g15995.t1
MRGDRRGERAAQNGANCTVELRLRGAAAAARGRGGGALRGFFFQFEAGRATPPNRLPPSARAPYGAPGPIPKLWARSPLSNPTVPAPRVDSS